MIANPGKFQFLIRGRRDTFKDKYNFKINDTDIVTKSSVTLEGVKTDNN